MDFKDLDKLEELFHRAKELDDDALEQYLEDSCRDRPDLRAELESLLTAHRKADSSGFLGDSPLDTPVTGGDGAGQDPHHLIGKNVGPYKVERFLGGGGMGDVYLAVRQAPFKILVGLKILRRGLRTDEVLRRFDVERQILASLNHPNIAKLLDGGVTEDGLPYFAMEYVDGMPITRYADRNRLTITDRLQLFQEVCSAVNYAHRNLVIHRDLKPPNIFVTRDGSVKLLDFGIAKIINPNLADLATPVTQTQYRMLTPDYASPEQVRAEPLSTASDVYSLGVILYELLSGNRPYRLEGHTAAEIERIVCDVEPTSPSRNVRSEQIDTAKTGDAAHDRQVSAERLVRNLQGDLDNIVMMALRKESSRRYQSVEQLTADIGRYLAGRPVHAAPDSRVYRGFKFIKRNAVAAIASAAIGVLLIGFSIYSSVQAKKLASERDRVQLEALKSRQVSDFVVGLFEMADPSKTDGDGVSVRSILDAGVDRVEEELADQPSLQAELLGVMARAYESLGQESRSVDLLMQSTDLRRGIPEEEVGFLNDLRMLATVSAGLSRIDDAEAAYEEFIAVAGAKYGPDHPEVLLERIYLNSMHHVTQPQAVADSIFNLWSMLDPQIDELSDEQAAAVLGFVMDMYFTRDELDEAERVALRAIEASKRAYGETTQLVHLYNRTGWTLIQADKYQQAHDIGVESIRIAEKIYSEGHRSLAESYGVRGNALVYMGRFDEAEPLLKKDVEMTKKMLGEYHFAVARPIRFLGRMYHRKGDIDTAIDYHRQGVEIIAQRFGRDYIIARQYELTIAELLIEKGEYSQAEEMLLDTYNLFLETRGETNGSTREVATILSGLYDRTGQVEESSRFAVLANAGEIPVSDCLVTPCR